jgi:hypothetical protein
VLPENIGSWQQALPPSLVLQPWVPKPETPGFSGYGNYGNNVALTGSADYVWKRTDEFTLIN